MFAFLKKLFAASESVAVKPQGVKAKTTAGRPKSTNKPAKNRKSEAQPTKQKLSS